MKKLVNINKERFRKDALVRLAGLDERIEKMYTLTDKVEDLVKKRIDEEIGLAAITTEDWLKVLAKLTDTISKLEKVRLDTQQHVIGSYDESVEDERHARESEDERTSREISQKQLLLLSQKRHKEILAKQAEEQAKAANG